jgi:hypothetical protein
MWKNAEKSKVEKAFIFNMDLPLLRSMIALNPSEGHAWLKQSAWAG